MNLYQALGVPRSATAEDIKQAFHKKALQHHPDRHMNASPMDKDRAAVAFKHVKEAYEVLSDVHKRAAYDRLGKATTASTGHAATTYNQHFYSQQFYRSRQRSYGSQQRSQGSVYRNLSAFVQGMTRADGAFHIAMAATLLFGFVIFDSVAESLWEKRNTGRLFKHMEPPGKSEQDEDEPGNGTTSAQRKQHPIKQGLQTLHSTQQESPTAALIAHQGLPSPPGLSPQAAFPAHGAPAHLAHTGSSQVRRAAAQHQLALPEKVSSTQPMDPQSPVRPSNSQPNSPPAARHQTVGSASGPHALPASLASREGSSER